MINIYVSCSTHKPNPHHYRAVYQETWRKEPLCVRPEVQEINRLKSSKHPDVLAFDLEAGERTSTAENSCLVRVVQDHKVTFDEEVVSLIGVSVLITDGHSVRKASDDAVL